MAPYGACKSYRAEFEEEVLSEGQILWSSWSLWFLYLPEHALVNELL